MYRKHVGSHLLIGVIGIFASWASAGVPAQGQEISRSQTVCVPVYSSIWYGAPYSGDKPTTNVIIRYVIY
jgi:hypothetical protein